MGRKVHGHLEQIEQARFCHQLFISLNFKDLHVGLQHKPNGTGSVHASKATDGALSCKVNTWVNWAQMAHRMEEILFDWCLTSEISGNDPLL